MRETEAALEFAQSQLAEQGEESRECLTEMERTLALLAFDNPEESPFGDLLNMMQRQKVCVFICVERNHHNGIVLVVSMKVDSPFYVQYGALLYLV